MVASITSFHMWKSLVQLSWLPDMGAKVKTSRFTYIANDLRTLSDEHVNKLAALWWCLPVVLC